MDELVNKTEYIIYLSAYEDDKLSNFYKGTFRGVHRLQDKYIFVDVIETKIERMEHSTYCSLIRNNLVFFPKDLYTFHDIKKVKENGKKAIENMEKRSLDMVLKRLVNEHFEW
jgi:hypothetical protein